MRYLLGCCAVEAVVVLFLAVLGLVLGWSVVTW